MTTKTWTWKRAFALIAAVFILPIPTSWTKAASSFLNPQMKEESTTSAVLLGIGGQVCLMPVLLGLMTILWEGFAGAWTGLAEGTAEIAAGLAALAGLYLARRNPVIGVTMIVSATAVLAAIATWALGAVVAIGALLAVAAVARWLAPAPQQEWELSHEG